MKFKIAVLLIILGILSVTPLIYMGKLDPMAFIDSALDADINLGDMDAIVPEKISGAMSNAVSGEKVQVYKWRDKDGVIQFGSQPPLSVNNAEHLELNTSTNVVKAIKVPEKKSEITQAEVKTDIKSPYSIKGMKKVMDDAKGVEKLLQDRHEAQQKMLNDL